MHTPPLEIVIGTGVLAGGLGCILGSVISRGYLVCTPYHNQALAVSGVALLLVLWSATRAALARFLLTATIAFTAMFMIFIAASKGFGVVGESPAKLMMVLVMGLLALWHPPANAWFRSKSLVARLVQDNTMSV